MFCQEWPRMIYSPAECYIHTMIGRPGFYCHIGSPLHNRKAIRPKHFIHLQEIRHDETLYAGV